MKVFIVHRDVPYEFGETDSVHSSLPKALNHADAMLTGSQSYKEDELTIEEWDLDGGQVDSSRRFEGKWMTGQEWHRAVLESLRARGVKV